MFKIGQQVKVIDTGEIVTVEMTTERTPGYLSVSPGSRVYHWSEVTDPDWFPGMDSPKLLNPRGTL